MTADQGTSPETHPAGDPGGRGAGTVPAVSPAEPPYTVECPTCHAPAGSRCKRPSGHSGSFVQPHADRVKAAAAAETPATPAGAEPEPTATETPHGAKHLQRLVRRATSWMDIATPALASRELRERTLGQLDEVQADVYRRQSYLAQRGEDHAGEQAELHELLESITALRDAIEAPAAHVID